MSLVIGRSDIRYQTTSDTTYAASMRLTGNTAVIAPPKSALVAMIQGVERSRHRPTKFAPVTLQVTPVT